MKEHPITLIEDDEYYVYTISNKCQGQVTFSIKVDSDDDDWKNWEYYPAHSINYNSKTIPIVPGQNAQNIPLQDSVGKKLLIESMIQLYNIIYMYILCEPVRNRE